MSLTLHANKLIKNITRFGNYKIRVYEHLSQEEKGNDWNLFIYDIQNRVVIQYHRECWFESGIKSDYRLSRSYTLQEFKDTWFGRYTIHYLI